MYIDHRMIAKISRVLSRLNMNIMLLDTNGQVILPEGNDKELPLPEALKSNPTQPLLYGGFTLVGTDGAQPLYLCLPGDSVDVYNCAILAGELISSLTRVELPNANREQAFRSILRDEIDNSEMQLLAAEHNIPFELNRCVIIVQLQNVKTETALSFLANVVDNAMNDTLVEIDRHTIALIKQLDEESDYDDMIQLGNAIQNTFMTEISSQIYIGIGLPKTQLDHLSESLREARQAIDVGKIYRKTESVFMYKRLLLERFLADVPKDLCQRYNNILFNRKTARLFNDEMIHTIEKFFENSLNLSETARQLYIHRNTLIYRLDKIQHIIGLDLRAFDDAVTFKMMMMMGRSNTDKARHT